MKKNLYLFKFLFLKNHILKYAINNLKRLNYVKIIKF